MAKPMQPGVLAQRWHASNGFSQLDTCGLTKSGPAFQPTAGSVLGSSSNASHEAACGAKGGGEGEPYEYTRSPPSPPLSPAALIGVASLTGPLSERMKHVNVPSALLRMTTPMHLVGVP